MVKLSSRTPNAQTVHTFRIDMLLH